MLEDKLRPKEPRDWWNVWIDGKLIGGFESRDVARALITVSKGDFYSISYRRGPDA